MGRLKAVIITDGVWPFVIGGMQKHSYLLCKYLAREGLQVVVLHPQVPEYSAEQLYSLFTEEEREFIEWVMISQPSRFSFPGHYLFESYEYSKNCYQHLVNRRDIGFIYAKGLTGWYLLRHKNRFRCRIGINIHGYEFIQLQASIKERANSCMLSYPFKYLHKRADCVFSYGGGVSDYIRKLGVRNERILEVPGAVEADWLNRDVKYRSSSAKRKLFFIGRYERRKGVEELNRILLNSNILNGAEFHFIGAIPQMKRLTIPGVHYHGELRRKEDILSLMDTMDVLVCPSYSEGMPNVIMEAMSRGRAIIATDVGAVSLLVDKKNGWLIRPASIYDLEQAMLSAINCEEDLIVSMGTASVDRISQHFTWDTVGRKTAELIRPFLR